LVRGTEVDGDVAVQGRKRDGKKKESGGKAVKNNTLLSFDDDGDE
jgi:hypothetical protein